MERGKTDVAVASSAQDEITNLLKRCRSLMRSEPRKAMVYVDEAIRMARMAENPRLLGKCFYELATLYFYCGDYAVALTYYKDSYEILKAEGKTGALVTIRTAIGFVYMEMSEYSTALEIFEEQVGIMKDCDAYSEQLVNVLMLRGLTKQGLCRFSEALDDHFLALDTIEKYDMSRVWYARGYSNIAGIYTAVEEYDKALEYSFKSLEIKEKEDDCYGMASIHYTIGVIYLHREDTRSARRYLDRAKELFCTMGHIPGEAESWQAIGQILETEEKLAEALACYTHALELFDSIASTKSKDVYYLSLAGIRYKMGDYCEAMSYLKKLLDCKTEDSTTLIKAYTLFSAVYEQFGDVARALHYHKLFFETREKLIGIKMQQAIRKAEARYGRLCSPVQYRAKPGNAGAESESLDKSRLLNSVTIGLVHKNEFIMQIKKQVIQLLGTHHSGRKTLLLRQLLKSIQQEDTEASWKEFETQFEQVHQNFIARLSRMYPALSNAELRVSILLRLGLSTKDIAQLLFLSGRTIDHHRASIRKKLGLSPDSCLPTHLLTL